MKSSVMVSSTLLDEDFSGLTVGELKARIKDEEKILKNLDEQEHRLQQKVRGNDTKLVLQNGSRLSFMDYAKEEAEETALFIQKNAEQKIKEMVQKVKELKARYDKEIADIQARIDIRKRYIITMFESIVVYLEDGDKEHESDHRDKVKAFNSIHSDETEEFDETDADKALQSLLNSLYSIHLEGGE